MTVKSGSNTSQSEYGGEGKCARLRISDARFRSAEDTFVIFDEKFDTTSPKTPAMFSRTLSNKSLNSSHMNCQPITMSATLSRAFETMKSWKKTRDVPLTRNGNFRMTPAMSSWSSETLRRSSSVILASMSCPLPCCLRYFSEMQKGVSKEESSLAIPGVVRLPFFPLTRMSLSKIPCTRLGYEWS
jgi:hypothetical protein